MQVLPSIGGKEYDTIYIILRYFIMDANMPMPLTTDADAVKKFKRDVVGACPSLVTLRDQRIVKDIPDEIFEQILREVFGGDNQLARNIMYNRFDRINGSVAEQEVEDIATLRPAALRLADTVEQGWPMLVISDIDNDGSLAQAMAMEFKRITGHDLYVQPRDYDPANHGFSVSQIQDWLAAQGMSHHQPFMVMVSDIGTNQRDTQEQFLAQFPQGQLIIADHHQPDVDMMVQPETSRSLLVSPFVKGSVRLALRGSGGVSGGYLTYALFKNAMEQLRSRNVLQMTDLDFENRLEPLRAMGKAANLLDYVRCDIRLKPLHEKEVAKALNVSKLTGNGRSVGKWLPDSQVSNIRALVDVVGDEGVSTLLDIRNKVLQQNHMARALFDALPEMLKKIETPAEGETAPPAVDVNFLVAKVMRDLPVEASADVNYAEVLRPYIFNFNYENQFEGSVKATWLELAQQVMRSIGGLEKEMLEAIRTYELAREVSDDYVTLTEAASPSVSKVFTTRQLSRAYQSVGKPVQLTVARSLPGQLVLSYRTEMSISELLHDVKNELPGVSFSLRGHDNIGGLTLGYPHGADIYPVLKRFVSLVSDEAKRQLDNRPLPKAIEVKPIHLPLLKEMLEKMRVHLEDRAAPLLLMRVTPNMTFEDKYTLEKLPVSKLVEQRPWSTTVEPLDFAMSSSLLLPNQSLKAIANDNFGGALGIKLLPNGSYMANKIVTEKQLKNAQVPALSTPLQRDQERMKAEYLAKFASLPVPLVEVPRKAAIDALHFTNNGEKVYNNTEAVILGVLNHMDVDSYVVMDVEADGAGNAQCFNLGFAIYSRMPGSGEHMSVEQFQHLVVNEPDRVRNFRKNDGDDGYVVNESLKLSLFSQVINQDGAQPIRVSIKAQNLTNMDQDFIDAVGISAEDAQQRMLAALDQAGSFVVQAHNLPYDNNIAKVNFPDLYQRMSAAIHLDTAPLAKRNQIAYMNVQVNKIDGDEFFNAEHPGYNLSTLMSTHDSFDYPSIKGTVVLQVRGDVVQKLDLNTRITTQLKMTRQELQDSLFGTLKPMDQPRYGIEKLLRMATVHDLITNQPLLQVRPIPFDGFGHITLPQDLWDHFQNNYAYDMTPNQNVNKFCIIPEVQALMDTTFKVDGDNMALQEARGVGAGNAFDPEKKFRSKADKAAHDEAIKTFSFKDVLHANAIAFVRNNPENAERFARSWVYELVLDHHETTRKDVPKSFIAGVSEMTGVSDEMVATIYDEMYKYKDFRGIQSYRVHETHNNVGLDGDVFQEVNVFMHMLTNRLRNPYLSGAYSMKHGISPVEPVIEALRMQAAESSLLQVVREVTKLSLDDDVLNNYSARQLDNFSDEGISIAVERSGVAKMKCKTLSASGATVNIELPEFDADLWRQMEPAERQRLEEKVEKAVTTLVLSNSRSQNALSEEGAKMVTDLVTHPDLIANLEEVKEIFKKLVPTQRESMLKSTMKTCMQAILGREPLKLPINKYLTDEDLSLIKTAVEQSNERLMRQQNFVSQLPVGSLDEALEQSKLEFAAFAAARNGEGRLDNGLKTSAKAELTKTFNVLDSILEVHDKACPDLAKGIPNVKKDPLNFMLTSPLIEQLMFSVENAPEMALKAQMELDVSEQNKNSPLRRGL